MFFNPRYAVYLYAAPVPPTTGEGGELVVCFPDYQSAYNYAAGKPVFQVRPWSSYSMELVPVDLPSLLTEAEAPEQHRQDML